MAKYSEMSRNELKDLFQRLWADYHKVQEKHLTLDMSRGKPGPEQLNLSLGMLDVLSGGADLKSESGMDCRNYGGLEGIPEARRLFAQMLEIDPSETIIGGNSSLSMMYDAVARAMMHGVAEQSEPWSHQPLKIKFLAPCPGYDRHFAICDYFHIDLIPVAMTPEGPDMEFVEKAVASDPGIKGIWCVPKYSNPQGYTYSDNTVRRFARLKPAASDFRIFWDNAYCVHDLTEKSDHLLNLMTECKKVGSEDMLYMFASTSKISFSGAGVAVMAASAANVKYICDCMSVQTISYDKLNQLRHIRFFHDLDGVKAHMKKHTAIIKPKFDLVIEKLRPLREEGIATFTEPKGGYFISLDTLNGCAKEVVRLCALAGVKLTAAGATYPGGKDPRDSNIRIAPTYPPLDELEQAADLLCMAIRIAQRGILSFD